MLSVVAPASTAACSTSIMKSSGVRGRPAAGAVTPVRPGQPGDHRPPHRPGDGLHGLEIPVAGHGEAGLDVVDTETRQLLGDLELLAHVERDARRLLPVSKGRVE